MQQVSKPLQDALSVAARWLLSVVFLLGLRAPITHFADAARTMEAHGVPLFFVGGRPLSHYLLAIGVTMALTGAISLALGAKARWGAGLLVVFLAGATTLQYSFWELTPGTVEHREAMIEFLKNAALLGALIWIVIHGAGPLSLDRWRERVDEGENWDRPSHTFVSALAFEAALGLLAMAIGWVVGHDPAVGLSPDGFGAQIVAVGWGVVATVPLLGAMLLLDRVTWDSLEELQRLVRQFIDRVFPNVTLFQIALISLAAGVGEELLFRGLLQEGVSRWLGGAAGSWTGLIVASVLFGLCHSLSKAYFVVATLMGFYLGGLLWITGDITTPIVAHALYDFFALAYLTRGSDKT